MPRWLPTVDHEELRQVRALAEAEGTCPDAAVKAFIRQEHRYYDLVVHSIIEDGIKFATAPLPLPCVRTPEGIEARRERTRAWWRANGAAYRAARKEQGRPLLGGKQYRQRHERGGNL